MQNEIDNKRKKQHKSHSPDATNQSRSIKLIKSNVQKHINKTAMQLSLSGTSQKTQKSQFPNLK